MNGRPARVLHVVGGMVRAGVETWLMHALRGIDRNRVHMDFLVQTDQACAYDAEIQDRDSRILRCTAPRRSPSFAYEIMALLNQHGPYDAIHSHVHHSSGYLLWLARRSGVPIRIAHSHSDTSRQDARAAWMRRAYLRFSKQWIRTNATHLVAASRLAGRALFGVEWDTDARKRLLHCGIDLQPFCRAPERAATRAALGIAPDEFVIGHTGRFGPPKNHAFLVDVAAEVARRRPGVRLLLVGDGPNLPAIQQRVAARGLARKTIFAGIRDDIPALMQAMDVFLFPSLWEGLPLTVLEAQAAGLPCVISDLISDETDVVPGLTRRFSLTAGVQRWASEVLAAERRCTRCPNEALALIENSSFNIRYSVEQLYGLYCA